MDWTAAAAGLIGAFIGAISSIATIVIQGRIQGRRESARLLFDTAFRDYELRVDRIGTDGAPLPAPFPVILAYHQKMMTLAESGQLTASRAGEILGAQMDMIVAINAAVAAQTGGVGNAPPE
jgi:hypothetical protein